MTTDKAPMTPYESEKLRKATKFHGEITNVMKIMEYTNDEYSEGPEFISYNNYYYMTKMSDNLNICLYEYLSFYNKVIFIFILTLIYDEFDTCDEIRLVTLIQKILINDFNNIKHDLTIHIVEHKDYEYLFGFFVKHKILQFLEKTSPLMETTTNGLIIKSINEAHEREELCWSWMGLMYKLKDE